MKLKFWKRSNKSKATKAKKGKRRGNSKVCTECDSLRTTMEELESYRNKVIDQQQRLDNLCDLLNKSKQEITEVVAAEQEAAEQSKKEEQCQMEKLRSSIHQMKKKHSEEVQTLEKAKEAVANAFHEYKTATEQTRRDEQEELRQLRAEIAELKEQQQYEIEQLKLQVTQAKDPKSYVWVLSLKSKLPAFHLARSEADPIPTAGLIQTPQRIGGLSYNPSTSAFHVYEADHDAFMSRQSQTCSSSPITPEDEEIASILSNVAPPGEYVRRHYGCD